jgi:hypothetical protein
MNEEIYNGAIDTQTQEQKDKNYTHKEVCLGVAPVVWEERPYNDPFTSRDQDGSGSCVTQTYASELEQYFYLKYGIIMDFSASLPYQFRTNKESSGCSSVDIYDVFPKLGNVFEHFMQSQKMSDEQIMAVSRPSYITELAQIYKIGRVSLPIDFDTVASTIQVTGKGVMLWFKFSVDEWCRDIPVVSDKPITSGHSVKAFDPILKNGIQYIPIKESWAKTSSYNGVRLITREYFNARCFLASYLMNFKFEVGSSERPHFDGSIISVQKCLQYEGLFALNVPFAENWGPITRSACAKFQKRYNISPALGNLGSITISKFAEVYP